MDYPGGRSQYQEKCQMLRKLQNYGAEDKVNEIIADWQKKYERWKSWENYSIIVQVNPDVGAMRAS